MAPKKVQMAGTIFIWIFRMGIWESGAQHDEIRNSVHFTTSWEVCKIQFFVFLIIILGKQKLHSNINKHETYLWHHQSQSVRIKANHNYQRLPKSRSSHGCQQIHDYYEDLHLSHINAEWEEKAEYTVSISDVDQHTVTVLHHTLLDMEQTGRRRVPSARHVMWRLKSQQSRCNLRNKQGSSCFSSLSDYCCTIMWSQWRSQETRGLHRKSLCPDAARSG